MRLQALLAEFIGTFALIFIGVGAIAANSIVNGSSGLVGIALAHGLTIAVMASATAATSGGHLNPAVTLGLLATKRIGLSDAAGYVIAQCLGGIAGAALVAAAVPETALLNTGWGIPAPGPTITMGQAFVTEVVLTAFLVFVVCGTAVDRRAPQVGALFIGLTATLDILMGGPISGAAMNPARHLGPAVISGNFANVGMYWAAPVLGGVLASTIYFFGIAPKSQEK